MSKKENTFGTDAELLEDEASFGDEPERRSLSKEMKIGAGLILLLVAVLTVVLVNRLRGPSEPPGPAAKTADASKPGDPASGKPKGPDHAAPSKPTVLAVTSNTSSPPPASRSTSLFPPGNDLAKTGSASGPPSFMPSKKPPHSAGFGSTKSDDAAGKRAEAPRFTAAGDRHFSGNPYRDPSAPNASDHDKKRHDPAPMSLTPAGPAAPVPGGPNITSTVQADPGGAAAATTGPYGSKYSGGGPYSWSGSSPRQEPAYANPPDKGSTHGVSPSIAPMPGSSSYERSPDHYPGADRDTDRFGNRPSASTSRSGGPGSGYASSIQAPTLVSPPPRPHPSHRQDGGRGLARGDKDTYVIQPNDNYCTISKALYGTDAYYKALAECNRKNWPDPNKLQVGGTISTPSLEKLTEDYPDLCPKREHVDAAASRARMANIADRIGGGRTYVVQEGDSLFDIAKYELGKASRWVEIYELNRNVVGTSFNYLTPGMKLALPENR